MSQSKIGLGSDFGFTLPFHLFLQTVIPRIKTIFMLSYAFPDLHLKFFMYFMADFI